MHNLNLDKVKRPSAPPIHTTLGELFDDNPEMLHVRDDVYASFSGIGYTCEIEETDGDSILPDVYELHLYNHFSNLPSLHMKFKKDTKCKHYDIMGGAKRIDIYLDKDGEPTLTLVVVGEVDSEVVPTALMVKHLSHEIQLFTPSNLPVLSKGGQLVSGGVALGVSLFFHQDTTWVGKYRRLDLGSLHTTNGYTLRSVISKDVCLSDIIKEQ